MAVLKEHLRDLGGGWPVDRGLILLREILASGKRCCLMCACKNFDDCHRKVIAEAISDAQIHAL